MTQDKSIDTEKLLRKLSNEIKSLLLTEKLSGRKTIDRFKENLIYHVYDGYGWSGALHYSRRMEKIEEDFGSLKLPLLDFKSLGYSIKFLRNNKEMLMEDHTKNMVILSDLFLLEVGLNSQKEVLASAVRANLRDYKMLDIVHLGVIASRISTRSEEYFDKSSLDNFGKTEIDYYSELLNSFVEAKIKNSLQKSEDKQVRKTNLLSYLKILSALGGQKNHLESLVSVFSSNLPGEKFEDDVILKFSSDELDKQSVVDLLKTYCAKRINEITQNYENAKPLQKCESLGLSCEKFNYYTILYDLDYQVTSQTLTFSSGDSHDIGQKKLNIANFKNTTKNDETFVRI